MVFQWRKWDGSPHWRSECVYLGADEWGDWLGQPVGWMSERPGRAFSADVANVTLVPKPAKSVRRASPRVTLVPEGADYVLTVHRRHLDGMRIYIDLAWDVRWSGDPQLVTGIDMDLDVVRHLDARGTWVADRDEWDEHRAHYGYPAEVVAHLEAVTLDLERRVRAQEPPFDDLTADAWLDRLDALGL